MRSLRLKILALAALLVVLTQIGTIGTLLFTARHEAGERARTDLTKAATVLERVMQLRSDQLHNRLDGLARDPVFANALASGDRAVLAAALAEAATRAEADLVVLLDDSGRVLAGTAGAGSLPDALPGLLSGSTGQDASQGVIQAGGMIYAVTTIAVGGAEGRSNSWLSMGLGLSDTRARRYAGLGAQDVAFIVDLDGNPRLAGTSLEGINPARLQEWISTATGVPDTLLDLHIAGTEYISVVKPLLPGNPHVQVLLSEPVDLALGPYRLLRWLALGVGLLALLVALAGAAIVARAIVHPVQRLARAAARIRNGDYSREVAIAEDDELGMLATTFNTMQSGIAQREERINYQARFDILTGLPNRLQALEQLDEAVHHARVAALPISVLVVDLGNFRDIAATLGHEISDALLSQAAERLRASADARHTVARLEGDEFLVILGGIGVDAARERAEDLLRLLDVGLSVRNINISLDAAVGIALFPEHGTDADQLLVRATVAKNDARNAQEPLRLYEEGREERRLRQLAILGDLRHAVRHDELKLYLQPKLSLADGRVCGAEALVRWDHPTLGWLPPGEFIGVAEQFGSISLVTRWALTAAVRECRLWVEEGLDVPVSVNLSGRDLRDQNLPVFIRQLLRDHDLAPRYLTVEITEESLVRDFSRATLVLQCLRDLGVRVSIDDFGTGYSSLAKLKHLPVDEMKIDRTFVMDLPQNPDDAAIIQATLNLAHDLGLAVVAEGVESAAALHWLTAQGCEQAQGYYISRPMPAETFSHWVSQQHREARRAIQVFTATLQAG